MPSLSSVINILPFALRKKFDSLGGYVQSIIDEEMLKHPKRNPLSKYEKSYIQLLAMIFLLKNYFEVGSKAAEKAAVAFHSMGFAGFQIGTKIFTSTNYNTRLGYKLALELEKSIKQSNLISLLKNSSSMQQFIAKVIANL